MSGRPIVQHHTDKLRFEISSLGQSAHLDYSIDRDSMTIHHTFVPPEFRGKGYAALLAETAFNYAAQAKLKIIHNCSYIEKYMVRRQK